MKLAYLILAHKDPAHLRRLIEAISTPNTACYIHLDKKSDISEFIHLECPNVHFIKNRLPIYYDYSLVEATLRLIKEALNDDRHFDYFIRIHGVDYPVQPADYIEDFFQKNSVAEFIEIMPTKAGDKEFPLSRLRTFEFPNNVTVFEKTLKRFLLSIGYKNDRIKEFNEFNLKPYWGSALWGLSRGACEYVLTYIENNPRLLRFLKNAHAPEEMAFQIILGNSQYLDKVANYFHFVDWSSQQRHPPELTEKHLEFFSSSLQIIYEDREILFANKFSSMNSHIVDELDKIIVEKEKVYQSRAN